MYHHLSKAKSLNEICVALRLHETAVTRIRGAMAPKRNTFSKYMNVLSYLRVNKEFVNFISFTQWVKKFLNFKPQGVASFRVMRRIKGR